MKKTQEELLVVANAAMNDKPKVTIFGKEMDSEALDVLVGVIGNSLNVIAEYGAINDWDEEKIKAATKSAAVGIAFGLKSLVYFKESQEG
ncbi:hypothetical protein ACMU9U_004112 [Yersinia enterocolitica]|uniref:hypothetical protein n=1 Tax=Yersinia enterocolitica TaxID=630 RepID=UPI001C8E782F|nr:hypothetical protein [Yersinia enterocolitica]EKN3740019.1 hypothetical protein [Yersinia enterocolitica]ELI7993900.1 hypothetical protein [Yersinia enterocolitica]MBX9479200.1 hypothetical protein [Yersinia enterocolitica]HDL7089577.1 hypothetical protein [Yersinia enterocolitica]HDL7461502.1 hypothetical protein [Yersinia enterocolitica]